MKPHYENLCNCVPGAILIGSVDLYLISYNAGGRTGPYKDTQNVLYKGQVSKHLL